LKGDKPLLGEKLEIELPNAAEGIVISIAFICPKFPVEDTVGDTVTNASVADVSTAGQVAEEFRRSAAATRNVIE
jgi:hypothetical protein